VNHTRFPKEDHLPYCASGQQSYEGWSCRTASSKTYCNCVRTVLQCARSWKLSYKKHFMW